MALYSPRATGPRVQSLGLWSDRAAVAHHACPSVDLDAKGGTL